MEPPRKTIPKRKDDRIILQFDYDCFYAQVHENKNPSLKSLPLGIRQKNILATCNYHARRLGVRKLMLATEAKKICPELVLVEGEDLTPFRDVSKTLFNYLRGFSWNGKVERLGFDEVFMDVTDVIDYNLFCLNQGAMDQHFFQLSKDDPLKGFSCNLTSIPGCTIGPTPTGEDLQKPLYLRLLLGSHLALHLRLKLEEIFGYTSTCGIATNKVLSKLAGSKNKPRNQTTLLTLDGDEAMRFMDDHKLRQIPGIGHKVAQTMESQIRNLPDDSDSHTFESVVTVKEARDHPDVSSGSLESLLLGPGSERGIGVRIWGLLHGVDHTEVKEASDVPSQISIEDTYKGLNSLQQVIKELHKLSYSLIRRLRVDLVVDDSNSTGVAKQKWLARPKTLRLATRSWPPGGKDEPLNYSRISRSGPLPSFVFDLSSDIEPLSERLVSESLLSLLRRLHPDKSQKWNLQLVNICAANMVVGSAEDGTGVGRDISNMFRNQDEVLRPWKVLVDPEIDNNEPHLPIAKDEESETAGIWAADENPTCRQCGYPVPAFALSAHLRFHDMEASEQLLHAEESAESL